MDNQLQIFNYEEKQVRTVQKDNEIWWVLKDVCAVLEIGNSRMVADRLDDDEKANVSVTDTSSNGTTQSRSVTIINESGLYNVILRSDKPKAKDFKRWVTHEILPSIRKHGAYMTSTTIENLLANPDSVIKLFTALKEEREQKEKLQTQVIEDKPKVIFADSVAISDGTILIRELAKILKGNGIDIGEKRLFAQLRDDGFLIKKKGTDYNSPTQKAMDLELFKVKESTTTHSDGHVIIHKTTMVTGKGQQYFVNRFLNKDKCS